MLDLVISFKQELKTYNAMQRGVQILYMLAASLDNIHVISGRVLKGDQPTVI